MKNDYLRTQEESKCFGCSACEKECPTKAITMKENGKGFQYPVLDATMCIECGKCKEVCPWHISEDGIKIHSLYAVEHKSEDVLRKSQSGGVFTALSDYILSKEGVVYGALFNDKLEVVHARAENAEIRDKMRESKYVQSRIDKRLLEELEVDCKRKRYVLFTGTPCQCAMVKKNFSENENLFVCEFICHGVPSPKVWRDYLRWREDEWGVICGARFRNKVFQGKGMYSDSLYTIDGVEHVSDFYAAIFYSHLAHRESCFVCPFAKEERYADITMGGFLDLRLIEKRPKFDCSMMFINSKQGKKLFEEIKNEIEFETCEIQHFNNQPCLYQPITREESVDEFWRRYEKLSMNDRIDMCASDKIKTIYRLNV